MVPWTKAKVKGQRLPENLDTENTGVQRQGKRNAAQLLDINGRICPFSF